MAFHETTELIHGIQQFIKNLTFPAGGVLADEKVFELVTKQDSPDIVKAVERVIGVTERVGAIVPGRDSYEIVSTKPYRVARRQEILIILSAVDFDPFEQESFFGVDANEDFNNEARGLLYMKDLLIEKLMGQPLANFSAPDPDDATADPIYETNMKYVFTPMYGEGARFAKDEQDLSDIREGYMQWFSVYMGEENVCTTRGARIRR